MRLVLCWLIYLYQLVVLVHIIASWVPSPPEALRPVFRGVAALVEPLLVPMRRVIPPLKIGSAALDSSILVLIVLVIIVQSAVC